MMRSTLLRVAGPPNRLSTRSTTLPGASRASHSPTSFDWPYTLRGLVGASSPYGAVALPSKTKSVL